MATLKMPVDGLSNTPTVKQPGWYHFLAGTIDENPVKKQTGEQIDKIMIPATVQGGTVKNEEKHQFTFWLRNPSESHKDGGNFCAKIQARFADALNILPKDAQDGEETEVPWKKGAGQQFVACLTMNRGTDGVDRLDLDGCEVYHVDDPAVSHIPFNKAVLNLIPANLRRKVADNDPANARNQQPTKAAANGNGNGNGAKSSATTAAAATKPAATNKPAPVNQPVGAGAGAGTVNLDEV